MADFWFTAPGHRLVTQTLPDIAKALGSIAKSLTQQTKAPDANELTDEDLTLINEAIAAYVECGCGPSTTGKFNAIRGKIVLTQMARKLRGEP